MSGLMEPTNVDRTYFTGVWKVHSHSEGEFLMSIMEDGSYKAQQLTAHGIFNKLASFLSSKWEGVWLIERDEGMLTLAMYFGDVTGVIPHDIVNKVTNTSLRVASMTNAKGLEKFVRGRVTDIQPNSFLRVQEKWSEVWTRNV